MTAKEVKSCIGTVEYLRGFLLRVYGLIDVVDDKNCKLIIELLRQQSVEGNSVKDAKAD